MSSVEQNTACLCLLAVKPPSDLVALSTRGNLTVCWTGPLHDPPDGYYVTSQALSRPIVSSRWVNASSSGELWTNTSVCVNLGAFVPGHTYDVAVVALRGNDRSEGSRITHTTGQRPKNSAQVFLSSFVVLCLTL